MKIAVFFLYLNNKIHAKTQIGKSIFTPELAHSVIEDRWALMEPIKLQLAIDFWSMLDYLVPPDNS